MCYFFIVLVILCILVTVSGCVPLFITRGPRSHGVSSILSVTVTHQFIALPSCSVLVLVDMCIFPVCVSMCTESLFYVHTSSLYLPVLVLFCLVPWIWVLTPCLNYYEFGLPFI